MFQCHNIPKKNVPIFQFSVLLSYDVHTITACFSMKSVSTPSNTNLPFFLPSSTNSIPSILRPNIIRKRLGLFIVMMTIIVVRVWVVRGPHIFHLIDTAAFRASLYGTVAGCLCGVFVSFVC